MLNRRLFLVFLIISSWFSPLWAQTYSSSQQLVSPVIAKTFYEIAYEMAHSENISKSETEQAIIFLNAAIDLDSSANYVHPLLLELASQRIDRDYSELVNNSLSQYLDKSVDLEPAQKGVQYLLQRLNFREQREQLLEKLLENLGNRNTCFDSELDTLLGMLMVEKTDNEAAQSHLVRAVGKDKYNKLAFTKLVEIAPEQVGPADYLEYLRLALGENLFDLEAALDFAQYAEKLELYQMAADAYKYSADLFSYLYPSQQLPPSIYIPWMISNYNTRRNQYKCLQIASYIRQTGQFDLSAEAIALKAAEKTGDMERADRIRQTIEERIDNQLLALAPDKNERIDSLSIAWFYCFASPDVNKALDWANRAYSVKTGSTMANAILAYSLVMNNQIEWAKPLIDNPEHSQIADLTLAKIQISEGQEYSAVETLKSVIASDPGSLEAEQAKEILIQNGDKYSPSIDPNQILMAMVAAFGQELVPKFVGPEKIISAYLNTRGSEFSYGSDFSATLTINNDSPESLVVSENGLFTGDIRVDASVTGDLNKKFPNLVAMKIRPSLPVRPGQSIFIPLTLFTGGLRQMLLAYPQASVEIEFTLYLDPVIDDQGAVTNRMRDLEPTRLTVKRSGVDLTKKYLQHRIASLRAGQQSQKIQTSQLLTGLLMEQYAMANRGPLYEFMYADWMPDSLKNALINSLKDYDWVVKTNTMADMASLPLDYKMIKVMSDNLNDSDWPVRLMAIYVMAKNRTSNFANVLNWIAENDSNEFVRNMAFALGGEINIIEDQSPLSQPPSISYSY